MPIALVEAPKTAIICSYFFPGFIWLAVGSKSYLNAERLAPLRGRQIMLYPDLNAFTDWNKRADILRNEGFRIDVSSFLEENANDEQKQAGLDLADFLLQQPPIVSTIVEQLTSPGTVLKPDESEIEPLTVALCDSYPAEWDEPDDADAKPQLQIINSHNYFEWQQNNPPFNELGLASLSA